MGRYYHGDIEGKFMFGVQSSTDADFFGVEGEATHLSYGFNNEDLPKVEEGIKECGREIRDCVKENDYYGFEAEL